ncbi:MAG: M48 family metallopeptidase [Burkholderiales bacterium]|jgi:predicted Zn-dependent protease|nr:M48 family metallopeptidase [Burkholderiales bacterium]
MRFLALWIVLCSAFVTGCATAPVTGRSQLILVSASEENQMGLSAADEVLKTAKKSENQALVARVTNVGKKIVAASEDAKAYQWEFFVLEDDTVNAFALPGGKVFFYTGILKLMKNDDQIATVMGHEIAHVLAHHGAERVSQQQVAQVGGSVLGAVVGGSQYGQLVNSAYGITANYGVLMPFSRKHESEADQIGVYLMFHAGYNPQEAVNFWQAMAAQNKDKAPEFLSTHPSDDRRIKDIEAYIKKLKK